jgi:16S rRNA (guanine(966)-N(2))-methyltransferase RsmD
MRIISGTYKGKRLAAPKSLPVRPTTDFAKEALFNILNNRLHFSETSLLDLFSGTGNISFEFGSRGCPQIMAVDSHHGCIKYISQISEELDFNIQTVKADCFKFLSSNRGGFDVIFADPPYAFSKEQLQDLVTKSKDNGFLKNEGIIIIEHSKHMDISDSKHFVEARRYGGSVFSFFE